MPKQAPEPQREGTWPMFEGLHVWQMEKLKGTNLIYGFRLIAFQML